MSKVAAVLLALFVAGCMAGPSKGTLTLPTVRAGGCRDVALPDATLTGDQGDPRVAWLIQNAQRRDVVFPNGYTARFTPQLEILDASGRVVARAGDAVTGGCVTRSDAQGPLLILWPPA
jgi:hypothetical protein